MSERSYIAPARKKGAREKVIREEGGKHGHAIYRETAKGISVEVHPRQIKLVTKQDD